MAHGTPPPLVGRLQPLARPPRVRAITLEPDEAPYRFYHSHPIVFLRGLVYPGLFLLLIILVRLGIATAVSSDSPAWLQTIGAASGALGWAGVILVVPWVLYIFADWRSDYLYLTSRRVIVNIETPGVRRELREVPMDQVQTVRTHRANLPHIWKRLLGVANFEVETAGSGRLSFEDISEHAADEAGSIVIALQKDVRAAGEGPQQQYRQQVVHNMFHHRPLPQRPLRTQIQPQPRTGFGLWNKLFPLHAWREGLKIVWHRHWWFLLKAEVVPVLIFLFYEITTLVAALVGNALNLSDNPVVDALSFGRPVLYLVLLIVALYQWDDWRNDQYIVDNDRLSTLITRPFGFDKAVNQTELQRVVDATVRVRGPAANLFRFGDIVIKTAAEATDFFFEGVPDPFRVQEEIMRRIQAQREQRQAQWDRDIQQWVGAVVEQMRVETPPPAAPPPPPEGWFF